MNKNQRKQLSELLDEIESHVSTFEEMAEEEQEKYDNMPENMQDSERAEAFQGAVNNLQEAADSLQSWIDEVRSNLEL